MSEPTSNPLTLSHHAKVRQQQRFIPRNDIAQTVKTGNKVDFGLGNLTVHYSRDNRVVMADNKVITVVKNHRNKRFNVLNKSAKSIENLKYQVEVKNNDSAKCELAQVYLDGEFINRDVDKAHQLYMEAALAGNSHAMCRLSSMYKSGVLGKVDNELSDEWMMKAADRGNTYALGITGQRLLAECIESKTLKGTYSQETADKAFHYLEMAVAKGATRALWTIGDIYEKGYIKEKNISKAIDCFVQGAKAGSPASVESLERLCNECLFSRDKFEDILNNLVGYLSKSSIGMLYDIGLSQLNGEVGSSRARGLNMIQAAADNDNNYDEAMVTLAKCYRDGLGCEPNLRLCQYWFNCLYSLYEKSAREGNVESLWNLGKYHMKGYIGEIDLCKAENYFNQVLAKSVSLVYRRRLASLYKNGLLGDKNPKIGDDILLEGLKIMEITASEGNASECYTLATYYLSTAYYFSSYDKAVFWAQKALDLGFTEAELLLSRVYLNKNSGYTDITRGLKIIENQILTTDIDLDEAFRIIDSYVGSKDKQYVDWLKEKAQPSSEKQLKVTSFAHLRELESANSKTNTDLLTKKCLRRLAILSDLRKIEDENCDKSAYHNMYKLFTEYNDYPAMFQLCDAYINNVLPNDLIEPVTQWMVTLPHLILETQSFSLFFNGASLFSDLLKLGKIHSVNILESAFWRSITLLYDCEQEDITTKNILEDLGEDFSSVKEELVQSECVANKLLELVECFRKSSLVIFKILSRILGDLFYGGFLVKRDITKAITWYSESSVKNNDRASFTLAQIFRYDADKKNLYRCLKYYKLAVKQGYTEAVDELSSLIKENEMFKTHLSFLDNYQHVSSVSPEDIAKTPPFKNLTEYPKRSEMFDLGMEYLKKNDVNNAIYWIRKSDCFDFDAMIQLFKMYNSGELGSNVVSVSLVYKSKCLRLVRADCAEWKEKKDVKTETITDFFLDIHKCISEITNDDTFLEINKCLSKFIETKIIEREDINNIYEICNQYILRNESLMLAQDISDLDL